MADRSHLTQNTAERERLRALVAGLSDAELARPVTAGWTVAGVLGHLAYWDQRIVVLVERWRQRGAAMVPGPLNRADVDWINDAAKPMLLALSPRRAAELAVEAAEAADRAVEALPDEYLATNHAAGSPVTLLRAAHRREHLDEIERTLRAA